MKGTGAIWKPLLICSCMRKNTDWLPKERAMTQSSHRQNVALSSDQKAFGPTLWCVALCRCLLLERCVVQRSTPEAQAVVSKWNLPAALSLCFWNVFIFVSLSLHFQVPNVLLVSRRHKNNNNNENGVHGTTTVDLSVRCQTVLVYIWSRDNLAWEPEQSCGLMFRLRCR